MRSQRSKVVIYRSDHVYQPTPILVINNGSSSLKFSVFDPKSETVLSSGLGERIGTEQGVLKLSDLENVKHEEKLPLADHRSALLRVIEILSKKGRFDCKRLVTAWFTAESTSASPN
jgi:acetate kinase